MLQYLISSSRYITPSTELASPAAVLDELRRIEAGQDVNDGLLDTIQMIATIMNGMQEDFAYDR